MSVADSKINILDVRVTSISWPLLTVEFSHHGEGVVILFYLEKEG
jgi:hypothetical protein